MSKCGSIAQYLRNYIIGVVLSCYISAAAELDEYGRTPLSKNITAILNRLVDNATYDKRLRPNYGGEPVEVGISIFVSSISAVSEVEMDYTLDFYLRQSWQDPRLAFGHLGTARKTLTVGWDYTSQIWLPDTFFPNEKKSTFHTATTHNSFLRISHDGKILTSQRLTVTASCSMDLLLFPLDSQECTLEIESYGYSTRDIKYVWHDGEKAVSKQEQFALPQFQVKEHKIEDSEVDLATGSYSRLTCRFLFLRSIGFYMIQIYLPSSLIVIISWVSFWLSRDATPARVALGVTTVLTMTTLMTTTNAAMPKVSYIKSIDVYLGTSFLMVFASLLEYAAVGYLNKRVKMKREIEARNQNQMLQQHATQPSLLKNQYNSVIEQVAAKPAAMTSRSPLLPPTNVVMFRGLYSIPAREDIVGFYPQLTDGYSTLDISCVWVGKPVDVDNETQTLPQFELRNYTTKNRTITLSTDGYSTDDIRLVWSKEAKNPTDVDPDVKQLPTFELVAHSGSATTARLSTGNYSRLLCTFRFDRNIGFYWIQIYQPSVMVVIISWVAFWINRDSAPARVTLGIMTVLTMTTLMTTTNRQMPKVSYIKAVDIYLGTCYVMVFAALLEYAAVSYSNKKLQDRKRNRQSLQVASTSVASEQVASTASAPAPAHPPTVQIACEKLPPHSMQSTRWIDPPMKPLSQISSHSTTKTFHLRPTRMINQRHSKPLLNPIRRIFSSCCSRAEGNVSDRKLQLVASGIDKYSRAVFPLIFTLFNIIYWTVFLKRSGKI